MLPYYLNATTNLMDRLAAPKIMGILLDMIVEIILGPGGFTATKPLLIVGMEMAGGAMVAQAAALAGVRYPDKVMPSCMLTRISPLCDPSPPYCSLGPPPPLLPPSRQCKLPSKQVPLPPSR